MTNEELGQLLGDIADRNGGSLLPKDVVNDARDEGHPLHDRFEWNDAVAGEKYREDQARQLIRLARINVTTPNKVTIYQAPLFIRDPRSPPAQQGYVPLARVKSDEDLGREVIIREFKRVVDALTRAQKVAALLGLQDDVDAALERVSAMLGRASLDDRPEGSA